MKLSIIVPVYYNELNLDDLYEKLSDVVFPKLDDYELIFVDDGSKDKSYEKMESLKQKYPKIKLVKLVKNYGSFVAILAGLSNCDGDCACAISADLQDPPEIILQMLEKLKGDVTTVLAVRKDREESLFQKAFSNTYYKLMRKFALSNMPKGGFDCFMINRDIIDHIIEMNEKNTSLTGQVLWCSEKIEKIYYVRKKREKGKSRWTLAKKVKYFIYAFVAFSYFPIRFMTFSGILFFLLSIISAIVFVILKLNNQIDVPGWTTLVILILFTSGLQMCMTGVLGEYLWRAYDEVRKRPVYLIERIEEYEKK